MVLCFNYLQDLLHELNNTKHNILKYGAARTSRTVSPTGEPCSTCCYTLGLGALCTRLARIAKFGGVFSVRERSADTWMSRPAAAQLLRRIQGSARLSTTHGVLQHIIILLSSSPTSVFQISLASVLVVYIGD